MQVADNKLAANKATSQQAAAYQPSKAQEQQVGSELHRKRSQAAHKQPSAGEPLLAPQPAARDKSSRGRQQQQQQVNGNADTNLQTKMRAGSDKAGADQQHQSGLGELENGAKQVQLELDQRELTAGRVKTEEAPDNDEQVSGLVARGETSDEVDDDQVEDDDVVHHREDDDDGEDDNEDEEDDDDDGLSSSGAASRRKMFVGGLSWQTGPEGLRDHFGQFGEITEVMIMNDPATRRSR